MQSGCGMPQTIVRMDQQAERRHMAGFGAHGPALKRQIRTLEREHRARSEPRRNPGQNVCGPRIQGHRVHGTGGVEGPPHLRPGIAGQNDGARRRIRGERGHAIAAGRNKRAARRKSGFLQRTFYFSQNHAILRCGRVRFDDGQSRHAQSARGRRTRADVILEAPAQAAYTCRMALYSWPVCIHRRRPI